MANLDEIDQYIQKRLRISEFKDSSLNGLQVEGSEEVSSIATAVDAGLQVIQQAQFADILITHHGIFWGQDFPLTGSRKKLIETLFKAKLSLYTVHLPLDAHPELGNNFALADYLGLENPSPAVPLDGQCIGCIAENTVLNRVSLVERLATLPGQSTAPLTLPFGPQTPQKIAIVSGSAANVLYDYQKLGFDTFITGEAKQFAYHFAKEERLNVIFAGHYATETLGVQRLGEELAKQFNLETTFIDVPTGI